MRQQDRMGRKPNKTPLDNGGTVKGGSPSQAAPRRGPAGRRGRNPEKRGAKVIGICMALVTLVFIVFGQTVNYGFLNYDDNGYVSANPIVSRGLTAAGVGWAFTHVHSNNWHPVTTIFHMLDCQLFGLWPGGHHIVNVTLHALCAVLLFLVLLEMTGAVWASGFVAAVFAIHPLRIESVAWVAELKDVLSGIFFMLALWAYTRYARQPSRARYAWVAAALALGLMSKPMLVTTPFVLLLVDYWPLGRLQRRSQFIGLLVEKLPLCALSALSCVATIIAQGQALRIMEYVPPAYRLENALVAYVIYIWKMIYPARLAVIYPAVRNGWPLWEVIEAGLLLITLTAAVVVLRRRHPYLLAGWLWYLGMLVPVIGILQVGQQAYADRYTYLPGIGLTVAGTWLVIDWAGRRRPAVITLGVIGSMYLAVLMIISMHEVTYWRDSISLWNHTLANTEENYTALNDLGIALVEKGQLDQAATQFAASVQIDPDYAMAHGNLGHYFFIEGRLGDAAAQFREVLRIDPDNVEAHSGLADVFVKAARLADAEPEFRKVLQLDPANTAADINLGAIVEREGRPEEAESLFSAAIANEPDNADAHFNLGDALMDLGQPQAAVAQFAASVKIKPDNAIGHYCLGVALLRIGRGEEALSQLARAHELAPADPESLASLAEAFSETGNYAKAIQAAESALELPGIPEQLAGRLRAAIKLYQVGKPFRNGQ